MMTAGSYVLVPGATGTAWYWHRLDAELRARGNDVAAVDLPADDDNAGLTEYAGAITPALQGRDEAVLVAQSMGAFSAPIACMDADVSLLVLVNAMIPRPGETPGEWWANTGQPEARRANDIREGRDPDAQTDLLTLFFHDVPQSVIGDAAANERRQSGTPFGQPWPLAAWPDVPTRALTGRDDRLFPAGLQRRVAQERLGITPDLMDGGHLVALSRPVELADRLEAYRAENLAEARLR
jgi:pimeloyl-ACP methyl ester carboxylesterase